MQERRTDETKFKKAYDAAGRTSLREKEAHEGESRGCSYLFVSLP